jgi:hypothetical protein
VSVERCARSGTRARARARNDWYGTPDFAQVNAWFDGAVERSASRCPSM